MALDMISDQSECGTVTVCRRDAGAVRKLSTDAQDHLRRLNEDIVTVGGGHQPARHMACATEDGRVYYISHDRKQSSWLPPSDCWFAVEKSMPYGWEVAADKEGQSYFINHLNKTTTYEDPRRKDDDCPPPEPRQITLHRDAELGFGFVAGSERPVLVRFVKEGGPSEGKLLAGDHILNINGEDVSRAPRERVIALVKSCHKTVTITVCQPHSSNQSVRKSAILTVSKKARLKSNPSRVRFAEGVVINESPLCPSLSLDRCHSFIPNVLKVFLENGQTKTFKYDSTTSVQDLLNLLTEKLSIKCPQHFALCIEHIKTTMGRYRLTLLDPKESLAKIAARPSAHNLRCLFRIAYVHTDAASLLQRDPVTFEYLYVQCCNDVVQERFGPELKYEVSLRLAALQLHQHAISNGMLNSNGKVNLKAIEKECGLHPFIPLTLLESMKRKELHKLLNHFLKQNQQLCPPGQKTLTALQAKVHYLRIIGELASFGAKLFPTRIRDSQVESAVLVSPRFAIAHVSSLRNCTPLTLGRIQDITAIRVTKEDDLSHAVEIQLKVNANNQPDPMPLRFVLEEKDADELVITLQGYHRLFNEQWSASYKEVPVFRELEDNWWIENAPCYHGEHLVKESSWAYCPTPGGCQFRRIDLTVPPPRYSQADVPPEIMAQASALYSHGKPIDDHDHNMNLSDLLRNNQQNGHVQLGPRTQLAISAAPNRTSSATMEIGESSDLPSIISTELLEAEPELSLGRLRPEDVVKRVTEMNQIVTDAQNYLEADDECEEEEKYIATRPRQLTGPRRIQKGHRNSSPPPPKRTEPFDEAEQSDDENSVTVSQRSQSLSTDTAFVAGQPGANQTQLKAADSLLLLTTVDGLDTNSGNASIETKKVEAGHRQIMVDGKHIATLDSDESDTDTSINSLNASSAHGVRDEPTSVTVSAGVSGQSRPDASGSALYSISKDRTRPDGHPNVDYAHIKRPTLRPQQPMVSSFGPHYTERLLPDLTDAENQLIESLKNIQDGHAALAEFAHSVGQGPYYYQQDELIDLTALPPPSTPDADQIRDFPGFVPTATISTEKPKVPDGTSLMADLNHLCDAISEMRTEPAAQTANDTYGSLSKTTIELLPTNIDAFIASLAIPPPPGPPVPPPRNPYAQRRPVESLNPGKTCRPITPTAPKSLTIVTSGNPTDKNEDDDDDDEEDIYASLIIPPPPPITISPEQDDVIAKFWQATDDVKKMCQPTPSVPQRTSLSGPAHPSTATSATNYQTSHITTSPSAPVGPSIGGDLLTVSSHHQQPLNVIVAASPRTGMHVREVHSSSSGDSAYDSIMSSNNMTEWPLSASANHFESNQMTPKFHQLPTVDENCQSSSNQITTAQVHQSQDHQLPAQLPDQSPGDGSQPVRSAAKPPIPPGSPSILERKRQIAKQRANGIPVGPSCVPVQIHQQPVQSQKTSAKPSKRSQKATLEEPVQMAYIQPYLNEMFAETILIPEQSQADAINGPPTQNQIDESIDQAQNGRGQVHPKNDLDELFIQSQQDIDILLARLEEAHENRLSNFSNEPTDESKFSAAREALIEESRQFVSASKLFVKCATESKPQMLEHLIECVALLERMYNVGELIVVSLLDSQAQVSCLVDRLKEVAATYAYTVDTVHKLSDGQIEDRANSPYMGLLMSHATSLATALNALMKTLRAI